MRIRTVRIVARRAPGGAASRSSHLPLQDRRAAPMKGTPPAQVPRSPMRRLLPQTLAARLAAAFAALVALLLVLGAVAETGVGGVERAASDTADHQLPKIVAGGELTARAAE